MGLAADAARETHAEIYGPGGYDGGWFNPANWQRGLYTGDPNASNYVYNGSVNGLGDSLGTRAIGFNVGAQGGVSTPFGGFSFYTPNIMLAYHFGTGEFSVNWGWSVGSGEFSNNPTRIGSPLPVSASVNFSALVITNTTRADDLLGPSLGLGGTIIGRSGVGYNVSYSKGLEQNGPNTYGFGPSFGYPSTQINVSADGPVYNYENRLFLYKPE